MRNAPRRIHGASYARDQAGRDGDHHDVAAGVNIGIAARGRTQAVDVRITHVIAAVGRGQVAAPLPAIAVVARVDAVVAVARRVPVAAAIAAIVVEVAAAAIPVAIVAIPATVLAVVATVITAIVAVFLTIIATVVATLSCR
jgi:hypothetical protein